MAGLAGAGVAARAAARAGLGANARGGSCGALALRTGGERGAQRPAAGGGGGAAVVQPEPGVAGHAGAQQPHRRGRLVAAARATTGAAARCSASRLRPRAVAAVGVRGGRRAARRTRGGAGASPSAALANEPPVRTPLPRWRALTHAPAAHLPAQRFGHARPEQHSFASTYASQARGGGITAPATAGNALTSPPLAQPPVLKPPGAPGATPASARPASAPAAAAAAAFAALNATAVEDRLAAIEASCAATQASVTSLAMALEARAWPGGVEHSAPRLRSGD